MATALKVPEIGESISEVEIGAWHKSEGDSVEVDDIVVTLESDKASVELPAPVSGVLARVFKTTGTSARVGEVIAEIEKGAGKDATPPAAAKTPQRARARKDVPEEHAPEPDTRRPQDSRPPRVTPTAQRLLDEHGLSSGEVEATGPAGRLLKVDVQRHVDRHREPLKLTRERTEEGRPKEDRLEELVPMSAIRRRIAERLVAAQREAALLTTINEIDMSEVIALRARYGETFRTLHGVKLGFMSFFVKAAVDALRRLPELNAEIRGDSIAYRHYYDIGIAVGGGKGLVVPVVRNADRLSLAEIEQAISDLAGRAREGTLHVEELRGGTFSITNGGIYGSLLSTPIVNPPQSGILGLHVIKDRPVVVDKQVVVRPMMYVALTYDHRLVDGSGAVTFLSRIKDVVEHPARLLLES